jgi:hypothetical protein
MMALSGSGQVRLNQIERGAKWDIPVAHKTQGALTGFVMKYMQLPDLMDSLNIGDQITDIRYYITSGDTIGLYYLNEVLDTTVLLYPDQCYQLTDPAPIIATSSTLLYRNMVTSLTVSHTGVIPGDDVRVVPLVDHTSMDFVDVRIWRAYVSAPNTVRIDVEYIGDDLTYTVPVFNLKVHK